MSTKFKKIFPPMTSGTQLGVDDHDNFSMCLECGSVVYDQQLHTSWHNPPTRMAAHGCIYSKDQIAAAKLRITCDRKRNRETPDWIRKIANV